MSIDLESHIIVIFGASGDLAKKKLLPAIYKLFRQNYLNNRQLILGVGRTGLDDHTYRQQIENELNQAFPYEPYEIEYFCTHLYFQQLNTSNIKAYETLNRRLYQLRSATNISNNILFYLATPPYLYYIIPEGLASAGLNDQSDGYKRIIIEKPFGDDEASAHSLNRHLLQYFKEESLFRIDHYLGKETVQNMMVFRFANSMFEPLWNANHIENIQIFANETIGINNRGGYYDQTGAIKDMIQNHLLQLLGIVAMEPPAQMNAYSIRNEQLKVFQSIRKMETADSIKNNVVIGQYAGSAIEPGYRQEKGVSPDSLTETFAAIRFFVDNWRWNNVPFYIKTGKRLYKHVSEVVINFKPTPHPFFATVQKQEGFKNQLVIRIQPEEGIKWTFAAKEPGTGFKTHEMNMSFFYSDFSQMAIPPAYERLILDALLGDLTLFARNDSVEASWSIIDPIVEYMKQNAHKLLHFYPNGSYGPQASEQLLQQYGHSWRHPVLAFQKYTDQSTTHIKAE
jgi:glucose-6-phosphate 1-dehydrogenase